MAHGRHRTSKPHRAPRRSGTVRRPAGSLKQTVVREPSKAHVGGQCPDTSLAPSDANLELVRAAVLCLVNRERSAHGETPLQTNAHLDQAAQSHSDSMSARAYFDHVGPTGDTPVVRMRAAGYIYSSRVGYDVAENLAWGSLWEGSPRAIVAAWMGSPGHRANILDPRFHDTGLGVSPHLPGSMAHGQPGAIYTQDFGVIVTG